MKLARFNDLGPAKENPSSFSSISADLDRAYQQRSYLLTYLTVDERLDKLHSDPRFDQLVRRVGLPLPR
jgi:hypothetical protein